MAESGSIMGEAEYAKHVRVMSHLAGIQSNFKQRRDMEARYARHHRARGVRLRAKYQPKEG